MLERLLLQYAMENYVLKEMELNIVKFDNLLGLPLFLLPPVMIFLSCSLGSMCFALK